tara:strand:- start:263 stop:1378 length:1116 start_codon:yes stop_codon:yes gene_type:complete
MRIELKKSKRIIIKIGSSIVNSPNDTDYISSICDEVSAQISHGKEIILVTSGAISKGMSVINITDRPKDIKKLQALAALGQQKLMMMYEKLFSNNNNKTAQILITHNDINNRVSYLNIKGTLEELIDNNIIPIINENDVVSTEEIKLGDNDNLASMISNLVNADLLIILTDQNGMYNKNPDKFNDAKLLESINIDDLKKYYQDTDFSTDSSVGTGGFITKIQAVKRAALSNTHSLIASGYEKNILNNIFSGSNIGTLFIPGKKKISSKKQWLDTKDNQGVIIIDDGAYKALTQNKSLLFVGINNVEKDFQKGDVIECKNLKNQCIAKGISNYNSDDVRLMKGLSSDEIKKKYHEKFIGEVIHIDNLLVIEL